MILLTILLLAIALIAIPIILITGVGGTVLVIVLGDLIVFVLIVVGIVKHCRKKQKKD